jgi:hypothetical protein
MQLTDGWKVGSIMWEMGVPANLICGGRKRMRFRPLPKGPLPPISKAGQLTRMSRRRNVAHRFGTIPGSPTRPNVILGIFTFFPGPTLPFFCQVVSPSIVSIPNRAPNCSTHGVYIFFPAE